MQRLILTTALLATFAAAPAQQSQTGPVKTYDVLAAQMREGENMTAKGDADGIAAYLSLIHI